MRFLTPILAFFLLAVALCTAQNASTAQSIKFSSSYEAPDFYATFPSPDNDNTPVTHSADSISLKNGGKTTLHNYTLSLHNNADAFLVLYCDIPELQGDKATLDRMLDGSLSKLDNAKPGPKTDSTYGGLPARMVSATGSYTRGKSTFKVTAYQRIAVQGSRVWQGIVICDQRTTCSESDARKFLDSIKIR